MGAAAGRAVLIGALIVSGLVAIYCVAWRIAAGEMKTAVADWFDTQRAAGLDAQFAKDGFRGFPFVIGSTLDDAAIADPGAWAWRAPELHVDLSPVALDRLTFAAPQPHTLDIAGVGEIVIAAPDGTLTLAGGEAGAWRAEAHAGAAALRAPQHDVLLAAKSATATARGDAQKIEGSITLTVAEIEYGGAAQALKSLTATVHLPAAAMNGALQRNPVDIRSFMLVTDMSRIEASGRLAVDQQGCPHGVLTVSAANPGPLALTLGEFGLMSADAANAAAGALTLASLAGGGRIQGPMEFRDCTVEFADVRLGQFAGRTAPAD